jgi:hypothetical protein
LFAWRFAGSQFQPPQAALDKFAAQQVCVAPLFRQADPFAKSFQSRIATKQSQFREAEYPTHTNRPDYSHAIQGLQCAFLIAQTREDHGLLERPSRKIIRQLSSLLATTGARIGVAQIGPIGPVVTFDKSPDCFLSSTPA